MSVQIMEIRKANMCQENLWIDFQSLNAHKQGEKINLNLEMTQILWKNIIYLYNN
jgi:hypothetical protein